MSQEPALLPGETSPAHPPPPEGMSPPGWTAPDSEAGADTARGSPAPVPPAGAAAPGHSGEPTAWRPGSIPLRPLDLGDVLDGTFGTIRRNPAATLGLSAVLVSVQQLLVLGAQVMTGDIPTAFALGSSGGPLQLVGGLGGVVGLVLSGVAGAVLTGMIVVVVSDDVLGRKAAVAGVWRRVRARLWALLAVSVAASMLPFVGLLLFVVPGIILWTAWSLAVPALVLERLGPIRALRRSWRLAWPDFWRVLGIRALSVVLGWLVQNLILVPFVVVGWLLAVGLGAGGSDQLPLIALALIALGSIAGGTISQPFLAGVLALLYVDRRMRAEGLDIVLQLHLRRSRMSGRRGGSGAGADGRVRPDGIDRAGPADGPPRVQAVPGAPGAAP